jgi:hypothetical protein
MVVKTKDTRCAEQLALADAIEELAACDAAIARLNAEADTLLDARVGTDRAVEAAEVAINRACPRPTVRVRMTGLEPVLGERPEPPPEMAAALATATREHGTIAADLSAIREQLAEHGADRGTLQVRVRRLALARLAMSPALARLPAELETAMKVVADLGGQIQWGVKERLVAVTTDTRWPEPTLAGIGRDRLGQPPDRWDLNYQVQGAARWTDALAALMADAGAELPE